MSAHEAEIARLEGENADQHFYDRGIRLPGETRGMAWEAARIALDAIFGEEPPTPNGEEAKRV